MGKKIKSRACYENMPLADFNSVFLDWTNENSERMERVSEDAGWNDFQVALTDEELSFVKLTVFLSGMENGKVIQSSYAGQPINPYYGEELPQKTASKNGVAAWCNLYYRFSYNISDALYRLSQFVMVKYYNTPPNAGRKDS